MLYIGENSYSSVEQALSPSKALIILCLFLNMLCFNCPSVIYIKNARSGDPNEITIIK